MALWNIRCVEGEDKGKVVSMVDAPSAQSALLYYNAVSGNFYRLEGDHLHFIPDDIHKRAFAQVLTAEEAVGQGGG